jgi:hypothetical protein
MALIFPRNILAYTYEGETFPAYISINVEGNKAEITIRGEAVDGRPGTTTMFPLTTNDLKLALRRSLTELERV